jgi:aminoglycoside 3-N-acetyltransferase
MADLTKLGLRSNTTVMVHCSLKQVGWTYGGPVAVIRALMDTITPEGTLVMPAESPPMSSREHASVFDPDTTPTTMGVVAEAFRTYPGTLRSRHPLVSVCANGPLAATITAEHSLEFCEGLGTPFDKLYELDAWTLLLGVGFNRCTSLHYAESVVPARRTSVSRFLVVENGEPVWVEKPDMAADTGVHFPVVGQRFIDGGNVRAGRVGLAQAMLCSTRALVDEARAYFAAVLA